MTAFDVPAVDAVRRALRAEIRAEEGDSQETAVSSRTAGPSPRVTATAATLEAHGSIGLVRNPTWTAWVLAVFPTSTDPVLAAAARLRALELLPGTDHPDPLEVHFTDDDTSAPEPAPEWDAEVLDLGSGLKALILLAVPGPGPERVRELTSDAQKAIPTIRRHLPNSTSWAVACLPAAARATYERAARTAALAMSPRVEVGHLAAALLIEADLETAAPLDGPQPDPAEGVLELFTDAAGKAVAELALRGRVARALSAAVLLPTPAGNLPQQGQEPTGHPVLGATRMIPGVTVITPHDPAPVPGHAVSASTEPQPHDIDVAAETVYDRHDIAAFEVAVQLGRSDTPSVWLAGAPADHLVVLDRLAILGTSGLVTWLARRHVLVIDPPAVPPTAEEVLATGLTYQSSQLVLAISQTATRLGAHLVRIAVAAGVPTILLTQPWQPQPGRLDIGSPPLVNVGGRTSAEPTVEDLLAPIAAELSSLHRVTLTPGVLHAAALPEPGSPVQRKDPFEALLNDDEPDDSRPDPVALGRSRLDYACSRAALRADRRVTVADVPIDPARGLPAGATPAPGAHIQFADVLAAQVVDQPRAVEVIGERLTFAARGLRRTGPRAALLFAGPPGTGKTHTAAEIAAAYYGDRDALIRVDCGAMYDRHTINALLGAPPAYVGYDDNERLLTTQITNHHGRCVVLFDEIEKADRRVLDILLGVLDSGQLTDLQQRTADATQAIFILTSNLGSELFTRHTAGFTSAASDQTEAAVLAEIRSHLRPELLDRLDDIVIYRPLTHAGITELTARHLATLASELAAQGYVIKAGPDVIEHLARQVEAIGVRGLRRHIESAVLRDLLRGEPGQYVARKGVGTVVWDPSHDESFLAG
jgi:hypothetical protein